VGRDDDLEHFIGQMLLQPYVASLLKRYCKASSLQRPYALFLTPAWDFGPMPISRSFAPASRQIIFDRLKIELNGFFNVGPSLFFALTLAYAAWQGRGINRMATFFTWF
jgi:hypothetical protein